MENNINVVELADACEGLFPLEALYSIEQLEQIRAEKAAKRGGFQEKILLMGVKES